MLVHTHTKNLSAEEKAKFEDYLGQKLKRIQGFIEAHHPDEDTVKLDVHMQKHDKHTAFECEFVLHLPRTHTPLFSKEVKHTITEPMDSAISTLEGRLTKHFKKKARR